MQEWSARDQEILKCPRLDRVMEEYQRNPRVCMVERKGTTMGLAERQRVFLAWFVQNCLLQIVVDSKSVLDSRNGHFHEENSTKFLWKIKKMPSLPQELTEMQIARSCEHGEMITVCLPSYKLCINFLQGSCFWWLLETIYGRRCTFSLILYNCSHGQADWISRVRHLWRVDRPLVGRRTLLCLLSVDHEVKWKIWIL